MHGNPILSSHIYGIFYFLPQLKVSCFSHGLSLLSTRTHSWNSKRSATPRPSSFLLLTETSDAGDNRLSIRRKKMGTLGKAIYTVGFWIRETGQALDRLGCRLQGNYYFQEQRKFIVSLIPRSHLFSLYRFAGYMMTWCQFVFMFQFSLKLDQFCEMCYSCYVRVFA